MANRNYQKGRRFEWETAKRLRDEGWRVIRASGSHGDFDLVAYTQKGEILFVQCKTTEDEATAQRLMKVFQENPPLPSNIEAWQQLVVKVSRKGIRSVTI